MGREWSVWVQSLSAIRPVSNALAVPPVSVTNPLSLGVSGYVGEAAGTTAGDNLNVFASGTSAVAAIKIATSTVSQPAAGTGTLFVGNQGTAQMVGPYAFGTVIYVTITPYATVDGSQAAGVAAFLVKTIDGSSISTPYNNQGSVLPIPFKGNLFTGFWGGIGSGQMYVAFLWTTQTLYKPDGSTLTLPGPPAALSLAGGDLGQIAGGVRGATTLWARRGLVKDGHVYALSGEQSFAVSANNRLTVAAPAAVPGYDGWCVLVGSASNSEYLQESGGTPYPITFGTNYTEPTGHFSTAAAQYTGDWLGTIVYVDLNASTTYYFYPYYDIALGFLRMVPVGDAVGDTAPSMADAAKAWSDGRIGLSSTNIAVIVGAGGTGGNSLGGGSRLT